MAFSTPESLRPVTSELRKTSFIITGALIFSLIVLYFFTPWPSVLPYRYNRNIAARAFDKSLGNYVPQNVMAIQSIQYDITDKDALLDVFLPPHVPMGKRLPIIVWLHGGDWISGSREDNSNFC